MATAADATGLVRAALVKIVSYNVHRGRSRRGRPVLAEIGRALADLDADVIACQEVSGLPADDLPDQAAWLARELGMQHRFVVNARTRHGPLGNATLSRAPIVAHENRDVSVPGHERRGALRTTLADGADVWNLHLGLTARQRTRQAELLLAALAERAGPALVCGDFNDWNARLGRLFRRAGFRCAPPFAVGRSRATFPAARPWLALDRIYHRGAALVEAGVLRGPPWRGLSDHLPVVATFQPEASGQDPPCS